MKDEDWQMIVLNLKISKFIQCFKLKELSSVFLQSSSVQPVCYI